MGSPSGIVALVMGIIAMATFWLLDYPRYILGVSHIVPILLHIYIQLGICIPTAILAIFFGGIGIGKDDSKAMAIIGLVFGLIVLALSILFLVLLTPLYYMSSYI